MLIKQQLTESLVLSVAGGAFGLLIAGWSNDLIGRNIRLGLTSTLVMPIEPGRVLGFTAGISILAGLGFGLIPAWLASRTQRQRSPQATSPRLQPAAKARVGFAASSSSVRSRSSLTLLSVAGMMIHGLNRTINSRPNWDSESILTANVQIDERSYETPEKRRAFHDALSARLAAIPGIQAHTIASMFPIAGGGSVNDVLIDGQDTAGNTFPKGVAFSGYARILQDSRHPSPRRPNLPRHPFPSLRSNRPSSTNRWRSTSGPRVVRWAGASGQRGRWQGHLAGDHRRGRRCGRSHRLRPATTAHAVLQRP